MKRQNIILDDIQRITNEIEFQFHDIEKKILIDFGDWITFSRTISGVSSVEHNIKLKLNQHPSSR